MPSPRSIDVPCPVCGHQPAGNIAPSARGAYCRCGSCRHMWHHDGPIDTRREQRTPNPGRRKSDENSAE